MRSKNQQLLDDIYDFIAEYKSANDTAPSNTEVAERFGLARSTTNRYMQELQSQGRIEINGHRSIRITSEAASADTVQVPLLGDIACGAPIFADGTVKNMVSLPRSLTGGRECFIVTAHGDSMINVGVNDGDMVLVEAASSADEGSIVVALVGDEATLKRFRTDRKRHKILLIPENDSYETQEYDHCIIQGIARKVISIKDLV